MAVATNQPINEEVKSTQHLVDVKQQQSPVVNQVEETPEDRNWKKLREERKAERKTLEEERKKGEEARRQAEALKQALEAIANKPSHASEPQELTEDDRINRAVSRALAEAEQKREAGRLEQERKQLPQLLAKTYQNFNEVVSDDNLDYLEYHYPEIYNTFKESPDSFDKWGNVYKTIKRFVPNIDSKKDEKKIEKNAQKPQSMSIPGMTATGDSAPMKLNEQRLKDNWARMNRVMKGIK